MTNIKRKSKSSCRRTTASKSKFTLSRFATALANVKSTFEDLIDDMEKFMSDYLDKFKKEVKVFLPKNYSL